MTSSACPLECDINLHKSNSTFLSDMDISRAALLTTLLSTGQRPSRSAEGQRAHFVLGAVHVSFYRPIMPFQAYEVRSQILGWDAKWIYVGTWFVRRGDDRTMDFLKARESRKEIFASGVSKYVLKQGRVTVPPVKMFEKAGLLPVGEGGGVCGNVHADAKRNAGSRSVLERAEMLRTSGLNYVKEIAEVV